MSHFYIMNATSLFNNKASTVNQVNNEFGNDQTILVAKRETGYDWDNHTNKYSKLFISGSGTGYLNNGADLASSHTYTQDTGQRHTNKNKSLIIENVISIDEEGNITSLNDIGLNEKRRTWCMK